jgi:ubiquinone/menaquinone biosynthesis C-methylase UbiE
MKEISMKINYNDLAVSYENTREIDPIVYSVLCCMLKPSKNNSVLDFGCGTGNYLKQLVFDYEIEPYGIDPSVDMCFIAQNKLYEHNIKKGDHTNIPFSKCFFDKIYCVDVIHHINNLNEFFLNLWNVASYKAQLCICTEASQQLNKKYWLKYFSSISKIDSKRFHTIDNIIYTGTISGWIHKEILSTESELMAPISHKFMKCVEQKTLSILHLISNEEYKKGLTDMRHDYENQVIIRQCEGYTFILFEKENT